MTAGLRDARPSRIRTFVCVSLVAAIYVVFAGNLLVNNGFYIDDRLYLYTINFLVCEPTSWRDASESLLAILERNSYSGEDVSIFQFRQAYSDNYLVHAVTTCMARVLLNQRLLDVDYGTWIYAIVQSGVGLSHLLCIGVVLWAVWSSRESKIPYTVLLGFGALAYLTIDLSSRNWRLTNASSIIGFLYQTTLFVISPGFEFDVFGITPRSDATLLFVAIMVFRWQRRMDAGYWTIVLVALVHGTYGALTLVIFLILDLLLQPNKVRNWRCIAPISLVIAVTLLRVQSFEAFDGTIIQLAAIVAAGAVFGGLATSTGEKILGYVSPVRWLRSRPVLHAETLLLFVGMACSVAVAFLLASFSTGLTEKYVAHELSGRPIALMRIGALLGICAMVMNKEINGSARLWPGAAVAVALFALVTGFNKPEQVRQSWLTAEDMESAILTTMAEPGKRLSRLQLYYVFSCSVDKKCKYLQRLSSDSLAR